MRREPTEAEKELWRHLRRDRLGVRFRRQVVVDRFIVDFYCSACSLVVEVDGPIHDQREARDEARDRRLRSLGLSILRVTNDEVFHNLESVLASIRAVLA